MKRRILFVDDEPLVLQGLQRMLRGMREEWEMEFVTGGAQALERMASLQFDVVVSDMRMPGMNGAELLTQVMQRYPQTVRLILSGHADKDLIMKSVGVTHQYLAKPCDPELLKATIRRACTLEHSLKNTMVRKLVAQIDRLPSQPDLYYEIVKRVENPESTIEDIAKVVARDAGMTANILKLVNSAFFGLRHEVSSPDEAVAYLGIDTLKHLVVFFHLFSEYQPASVQVVPLSAVWRHSLQTAGLARAIACLEGNSGKQAEEAFCSGMLHDVGELVLAANMPQQYGEVVRFARETHADLVAAEERMFGVTHADVGSYLLGLWGLPASLVDAVASHHEPTLSQLVPFSTVSALHAADVLMSDLSPQFEGIAQTRFNQAWSETAEMASRLPLWRETAQGMASNHSDL